MYLLIIVKPACWGVGPMLSWMLKGITHSLFFLASRGCMALKWQYAMD